MDHHHTKNLCYTPANELLIFSWNSEFVDEHQLQVSFGDLDWTGLQEYDDGVSLRNLIVI